MRPPSPRRPGGKREQPSDAAGDEPDVGEATPASSQRARPGKGREERNPREGTQRSTREGFAQRRTRERGGEKSSREEARERRARARAERAAREQGEERHSRAVERRTTRGVLATPVAAADAATLLGSEEATDLGDRLRERTRARRMLGAGWLAFFSPLFALSTGNIQVTGEDGRLVTVDSVRSSVSPFEGVPLTRLDTQAVSRAVQENVAVKSASVSRRWPTSLKVSVTMRAGIAVEAAEGTYWLVDDQGVRFERVSSVGGYPLVTLSGDRAAGASDVASMLGALDQSTRSQVSAITSTGTQVNFTLRGGQTVKWGTSGDAPQKARVLATLLANVKATTYDVSAPNHPVTS